MHCAQAKYIDNADAHRLPIPAFQPGDLVLGSRDMRTIRRSRELDDRNAGLFAVVRQANIRSYELGLPANMEL